MAQGAKKAARKKAADPYKVAIAARIKRAFLQHNVDASKALRQEDLGRLVAHRLKLKEPFTQAAVSDWMNVSNPSVPELPTIEAIADVLRVDKTWLAFGASED